MVVGCLFKQCAVTRPPKLWNASSPAALKHPYPGFSRRYQEAAYVRHRRMSHHICIRVINGFGRSAMRLSRCCCIPRTLSPLLIAVRQLPTSPTGVLFCGLFCWTGSPEDAMLKLDFEDLRAGVPACGEDSEVGPGESVDPSKHLCLEVQGSNSTFIALNALKARKPFQLRVFLPQTSS